MRHYVFSILLFLPLLASAQVTMSGVLKAMPDSLLPYLTTNNRLDCIDFKEAGMKAEVRNQFDGKTEMLALTERYSSFQLSAAAKTDLLLLDAGSGQVVCVVTTYGAQLRESCVEFYTPEWQSLPASEYIDLPGYMFTAEIIPEEQALLIQSVNTLDRPAMEDQKETPIQSIKLKWNGGKFK